MRLGFAVVVLASALVVACGRDAGSEGSAEAASDVAPSADEAAIQQIATDYAQHYNLHHASVVADLFSDSAVALYADGGIHVGKAAITADLEADMANSPNLTLTPASVMVFGDRAVGHGEYTVTLTPPGGTATTLAGHYMTAFGRQNGAWKIDGLLTNLNADPPADLPMGESPAEAPPDNGTMTELVAGYTEHFNLGHANAVAALYTEDATVSFANRPVSQGRAAVEAALAERLAVGSPKIEIHDVNTEDIADGWKLDGGWYRVTATPPEGAITQEGTYVLLARREPDGSWKIHWAVTNGRVTPAAR